MRGLAAWAAMLSLLTGFLLPFGPGTDATDSDGICGPVLVLEHSITHFEPTPPPDGADRHCAFCHWRNTMASAAAASPADVVGPSDATRAAAKSVAADPDIVVIGAIVPRGPPAVS